MEKTRNPTEFLDEIMKIVDGLREKMKVREEVIPQEKKFDVELQETKFGTTIKLRRKEQGNEKNLADFLPPGYSFNEDIKFTQDGLRKKVGFLKEELQFRGFLLSLFHEIGHAHDKHKPPITKMETLIAILQGALKLLFTVVRKTSIKVTTEQEGKTGEKKVLEIKLPELIGEAFIPQWYFEKMTRFRARQERNAWAFALVLLRKLKREGYDVFAGYENVNQIKTYIADNLTTYEVNLLLTIGYKGYEKLSSQSPLFLRRYAKR